jgi:hypothetical protein
MGRRTPQDATAARLLRLRSHHFRFNSANRLSRRLVARYLSSAKTEIRDESLSTDEYEPSGTCMLDSRAMGMFAVSQPSTSHADHCL